MYFKMFCPFPWISCLQSTTKYKVQFRFLALPPPIFEIFTIFPILLRSQVLTTLATREAIRLQYFYTRYQVLLYFW